MQGNPTSLSLLERVRDHDREAWQRLLYLYAPLVRSWCRRWGVQGADAEDIQQEVFLSVSRGLESFRRDRPGDTFRGWLRVVARRKFLDHCRSKLRQPGANHVGGVQEQLFDLPDTQPPEADDSPEEVSSLHHRALELVRGEFEVKTWQAFWHCAVEGKAPGDVAGEMGMTPGAIRKAKSRVLRRLKDELGDLLG